MNMNFESQPNNNEENKTPENMDDGIIVNKNEGLYNYFERITKIKEAMIHAGPDEKDELEREFMKLQKEYKEEDIEASSKEKFPNNNNVYEIPEGDEGKKAA